ncbi:hypothetical protein [Shewanella surugensis]|uniref:Uncharacterized protein n=1 Tax=Shewanella surugensis TaxID=212020 RepID=A0ABT0LIQ2_9GAMM|nr:hypothetical protein [Shewanella surugensis]MCL1127571.1 hypothetical protein [Shewanella surugensis]
MFSSKPGGEGASPLAYSYGNAAPCVKSVASELSKQGADWYAHTARKLKQNEFKLLFPYKYQAILESTAAYRDCTASHAGEALTVEVDSRFKHQYYKIGYLFLKNRIDTLWHGGIPSEVYKCLR